MPPRHVSFRQTATATSPALLCALALVACGGGGSEANTVAAGAPNALAPASSTPTAKPPTAAAFAPSARVASIELAQSLLLPGNDNSTVLVADKAALVKVNVTTSNTAEGKPTGNLRVENASGQLLQTIALTAPTSALPAAVPQVPSFADSYTAVLPGELVKSGLRLSVAIDNGQPATTINPKVGTTIAMQLVAVPVQISGVTGQVVPGAASYAQARMPVSRVSLTTRAAYVPKSVTSLPTSESGWSTAFSSILSELADLHTLENASDETYYYGFLPKRTFGSTGLGYRPGNAALGFDKPDSAELVRSTMTHELGHNTSLSHAPCGGPANPDPQYPYANAQLGAAGRYIWGYNADTKAFTDPRRTDIHDMMSYCDSDTFSDYNYRKAQVYLTSTAKAQQPSAQASADGAQELLFISGQIDAGKLEMKPLKTMLGPIKPYQEGPYTLRITTAQGATEYKFDTNQVDHMDHLQRFGLTVPHPGAITSMSITKGNTMLMQTHAKTSAAAADNAKQSAASVRPQVQVKEQNGLMTLTWDHARHPYLTVTYINGAKRSTLAQDLEGGRASLPAMGMAAGGSFEFSLSDGLNSMRLSQSR